MDISKVITYKTSALWLQKNILQTTFSVIYHSYVNECMYFPGFFSDNAVGVCFYFSKLDNYN